VMSARDARCHPLGGALLAFALFGRERPTADRCGFGGEGSRESDAEGGRSIAGAPRRVIVISSLAVTSTLRRTGLWMVMERDAEGGVRLILLGSSVQPP